VESARPGRSLYGGRRFLLTSFGCFWAAEGAGVHWPGDELALLGLLGFLVAVSLTLVRLLRHQQLALRPLEAEA